MMEVRNILFIAQIANVYLVFRKDKKMTPLLKHCREPEQDIYRRALNHFGDKNQILHTIGELSELTIEIGAHLEGRGDHDKIINELADVENMLHQMRIIFDEPAGEVDRIKTNKMERLKRRMDGDE